MPWPALAATVFALGGALLFFSPLTSSRPPAGGEQSVEGLGFQDASARLWQDPFKAARERFEKQRPLSPPWRVQAHVPPSSPAHPTTSPATASVVEWDAAELYQVSSERGRRAHDLDEIRGQIGQDDRILVIAVMIPAGAYAELAEQRLRTRVAVLEGLGLNGFEPADGEHVGYFSLPWLWKMMENYGDAADAELVHAEKTPGDQGSLMVPYEWALPAQVPMAATNQPDAAGRAISPAETGALPTKAIPSSQASPPVRVTVQTRPSLVPAQRQEKVKRTLVLWLAEEAFSDRPLTRLAQVFEYLGFEQRRVPVTLRIIGPRISSTLRAMALELGKGLSWWQHDMLTRARFYSPTATAADEMLLLDVNTSARNIPSLFAAEDLNFQRTTISDASLCVDLVTELERRGLKWLAAKQAPEPGYTKDPITVAGMKVYPPDKPNHVAVVAEWDTFYGRALPTTFAAAVLGYQVSSAAVRDASSFPPWVHHFVYLRGIDGKATSKSGDEARDPTVAASAAGHGTNKFSAPGEQPEGTDQSDYLRRLADQLAVLDTDLRRRGERGLDAIGVLGTDEYDKLLVLRALRDRLPAPLYFTTNLDARYALPSEWRAAHNLVIASPFGQRLHSYYQHNIPPFRDSYQTAVFASTLAASGGALHQNELDFANMLGNGPTRLFEIGRNGPVDLSVGNLAQDGSSAVRPQNSPEVDVRIKPPSIYPPRYDLAPWRWTTPKIVAFVAVGLLLLIGWLFGVRPAPFQWSELFLSSGSFYVGAIVLVGGVVAVGLCINPVEGEPLRLIDGVSVWPTIAIRLFAALLCVHLLVRSIHQAWQNDQDIQVDFKLRGMPGEKSKPGAPSSPPKETDSLPVGPHELAQTTFMNEVQYSGWHVTDNAGKQVYAQNLWWEYRRRTAGSVRIIRVLTLSALYLALGLGVILWLGKPVIPARGEVAQDLELVSLIASVLLSVVLTFFVLDSTYINKRFIDYLVFTDTDWPAGAFDQLKWGMQAEDLTEYLDIRLIAKRTAVVGRVIYYPFVILVLMIVARNPLFDNWDWPLGLVLILAGNLVLAIVGALMLRGSAEQARRTAMEKLRERLMRHIAAKKTSEAATIEKIMELVKDEREGAFSALSQYPRLAAVLLPSGGIGLWALLEYVAKTLW